MDIYKTDEEKGEALKQWIRENGLSVIGGLMIGLAIIFGGRSWFEYGHKKAEQASYIYFQMMDAADQGTDDTVMLLAGQLRDNYADTPYAATGAMMQAKIKQAKGDLDGASADLKWVIAHADISAQVHGARLRLIRALLAGKKFAVAQQEISAVKDMADFVVNYEDLQGDIYIASSQPEQARIAYQRALDAISANATMRSMIEVKKNSIVGVDIKQAASEAVES